jgi:predicted dehydrogenase
MRPGAGWGEPDEDWSYMLIQGCHPIDLMRHFLGPIGRVAAFRRHGQGVAKVYQVAVEGRNGRVGFLNFQDSYDGWTAGLEVVGDGKAVVTVDDLGRVLYRRGERRTGAETDARGNAAYLWEPHHTLPHWRRSGYGNQLRAFARAILAGETPTPSLHDGWRNLLVARCILESCASRQVVAVPEEA